MDHTKASIYALESTLACLVTYAFKLCVLRLGCWSRESVGVRTCLICVSPINRLDMTAKVRSVYSAGVL